MIHFILSGSKWYCVHEQGCYPQFRFFHFLSLFEVPIIATEMKITHVDIIPSRWQ